MFTVVTDNAGRYCIKHNYQLKSCESPQAETRFICKVDEPQGYQMTATMTIFKEGKNNTWNIPFLPCFYFLSEDH